MQPHTCIESQHLDRRKGTGCGLAVLPHVLTDLDRHGKVTRCGRHCRLACELSGGPAFVCCVARGICLHDEAEHEAGRKRMCTRVSQGQVQHYPGNASQSARGGPRLPTWPSVAQTHGPSKKDTRASGRPTCPWCHMWRAQPHFATQPVCLRGPR